MLGGQAGVYALAARASSPDPLPAPSAPWALDALETRVGAWIEAYDAQGNHRTGTGVDAASAEWLANQVRQLGAEPSLEPFTLDRLDPQSCYLRIAGRRIGGVPLFDGGATDANGLHGHLGPVGGPGDIGLAETPPFRLHETASDRAAVDAARRGAHRGVVLVTQGRRPGLSPVNASAFANPSGPPMLQVSSTEGDWLKEQAQRGAEATLVVEVTRTPAQASNVTARVRGRDSKLAPLVLMAPRSGWWNCASEQGGRLACWLEALRVVAAGNPARDCLFVALTGHEIGYLGIDAYNSRRPDLLGHAYASIFFGSGIGEPRQPNLIHASDDALERRTVAAMEKEGLSVDGKAPHDAKARGEAGMVQRAGGRFVTVACDSDVYHNGADRWPQAVDAALLARYAAAFANVALQLVQQSD
jgi:hypothetical protein